MEIAVISFTRPGKALAEKLSAALEAAGHRCRFAAFSDTGELFTSVRAMIFVGAAGIAVRAIAPFVKSKYSDPAVVVCDERGLYAISLLSGHEGGANELTREVAGIIGASPVITTASELKTLVIGCGCRKGVSAEHIEEVFLEAGVWPERIAKLCTIDIKRNEAGLTAFAENYGITVVYFSAEQLRTVQGSFSGSGFVEEITGVDNVCERAAVLGGGNGRLTMPKYASKGVTLAVFEVED